MSPARRQLEFEARLFGWKGFLGVLLFSIPFGFVMLVIFRFFDASTTKTSSSDSFGFFIPTIFWLIGKIFRKKSESEYQDLPEDVVTAMGTEGNLQVVSSSMEYPIPLAVGTFVKVPKKFIEQVSVEAVGWMVRFIWRRNRFEQKFGGWMFAGLLGAFFLVSSGFRLGGFLIGLTLSTAFLMFFFLERLQWSLFVKSELDLIDLENVAFAKEGLHYAIQKQAERPFYNKWMYSSLKFKNFLQILEEKKSTT
jgi:hypothetical protein